MTITTNHTVDARHHGAVTNDTDPDPEVPERAKGPRRFPASYEARILTEYETLAKLENPRTRLTSRSTSVQASRTPDSLARLQLRTAVPEACESGRIGTIGNRVWGNPPWVQIPPPPPRVGYVSQALEVAKARRNRRRAGFPHIRRRLCVPRPLTGSGGRHSQQVK